MNESTRSRLGRVARRIAWPASIAVAFGLGAAIAGDCEDGATRHRLGGAEREARLWTCAMHPQIQSPEPGVCPICGMDLVPVGDEHGDEPANPGRISLSERARVRARIRTSRVQRLGAAGVERRLLGKVDYDETRLRTITSWIGGRIEQLHVRTTGERVRAGQAIATLYSPEVFSAHQDLLVASQQVAKLRDATEMARAGASATLDAARDRLRLVGVPTAEISAMEHAKAPSERVRIRTPYGGTVIERMATEGTYVDTGSALYQVADLSRLWIQLDAYESDLPSLGVGQEVVLEVEALPGDRFEGTVTFVDPVLDPRTRTTRVRIEVENPDGRLRPGMFAEAVVRGASSAESPPGSRETPLAIPHTAPLFTGRRSVVYVDVPGADRPTYEVRVVQLGPRMGDVYPVVSGLDEGERVVIHGAFALDADLQIRGGPSMMTRPDDSGDDPVDPNRGEDAGTSGRRLPKEGTDGEHPRR